MITISDPRQVWQEFSTDYRNTEPIVSTSPTLDSVIDSIVHDIRTEQRIRAFNDPQVVAQLVRGASGGRGANKHFLDFLGHLQHFMAEEQVVTAPLIRAVNLLFNYDYLDDDWTQPLLWLDDRPGDRWYVVSTTTFEKRHGHRVELELLDMCSADCFFVHESWRSAVEHRA
jgi:hypothetical protein